MLNVTTHDQRELLADEDRCWNALLARDAALDGLVFFGIRSTGIYCRPVCPARKPRREHVAYFGSAVEAERAGYRPCLRCRPREVGRDLHLELVALACRYLDEHGDETATLAAIGEHVGCSPHHLQRVFKEKTGISPRQYAAARRVERLKGELIAGVDVTRATYAAGYGSSSRLYEASAAELGMTPATYRRGGEGVAIAYAVAATPLGWLLVARTARGICAIRLGDDPADLASGLCAEYPRGQVTRDDAALDTDLQQVVRLTTGEAPHVDLPVDIQATAFQRRVWEALRQIPRGEVRTYGQIAAAIGQPEAVRAVGRACGANPVALAIPCHRVVGADGSLGGYRWGVDRKRQILEAERLAFESAAD
ncbi:MAG TPA: bifunctional DNA-binding transcriptional regulator/O6-methylguanine-DNA methyltransferase Ada [Thermomicrobiales bacterium]|jgi:AraC family transcriptional regulator of adaptative response/methylated-DNA-[protein]-cysteine methyltransferase